MKSKSVVKLGYDGKYYILLSCPKRWTSRIIFADMQEVFESFPLTLFDFKVTLIDKPVILDDEILWLKTY